MPQNHDPKNSTLQDALDRTYQSEAGYAAGAKLAAYMTFIVRRAMDETFGPITHTKQVHIIGNETYVWVGGDEHHCVWVLRKCETGGHLAEIVYFGPAAGSTP